MARFLALIYDDEQKWAAGAPETVAASAAHTAFATNHSAAMLGGNALQPTSTATSVVTDADGTVQVTDGPFVETKEVLGGYYLFEADHLDAALDVAARVPAARMGGAVEVRPLVER